MGLKIRDFSASVIRKIFGLLEFFLFLRVVLEFLNANPAAVVADYFYPHTERKPIVWGFIGSPVFSHPRSIPFFLLPNYGGM